MEIVMQIVKNAVNFHTIANVRKFHNIPSIQIGWLYLDMVFSLTTAVIFSIKSLR